MDKSTKSKFLQAKKELAIYKWADKKTKRGFSVLYKEIEQGKKEKEQANAKTEAFFTSVPDGILALDLKGRVIKLNEQAEKILGYSKNEALNKHYSKCFQLSDGKGTPIALEYNPLEKALANVPAATISIAVASLFLIKKNGKVIPVALNVATVAFAKKVAGLVIAFHDISQEKELEKLRLDFLSLASHQLRTPLSGTKWLIETMQRNVLGPLTKKQKEYLDQIYQLNERMTKLVFEMLNVLRIEDKGAIVKKEIVPIVGLYQGVFLAMGPAAKNKKVVLFNALKNHRTVALETDKVMLEAILECFVSNAIDYSMPNQKVILDVKEEKDALVFFIKDNGIGIPKEEKERIFQRFYRASNAKGHKPDGTGLGLYTASMLAEKLGAKISFESEQGKGSIFYLRIPKKVV